MTKLTTEQLEAIQGRCDAATEGPWEAVEKTVVTDESSHDWMEVRVRGGFNCSPFRIQISNDSGDDYEDATFIAHSRTDVPALMSHAETMAAEHAIEIAEKDARIRELEGQFNALIDARRIQAKALRDGGEDG